MSITSLQVSDTPGGIRRVIEARKARHRLYPVTIVYTLASLGLLTVCVSSEHWLRGLLFYGAGFAVWTWMEYEIHRYILHGRFPEGPGLWRRFLHKNFDHLHWEHHARPWDGNHVNGTLKDTGAFIVLFLGLSFVFPAWTMTMVVAGIMQAYIAEEWVHHSVHFCNFRGKYFRYIKRHHMFHHSPKGSEVGYGLTNGFWDIVFGTRIPAPIRRAMYGKRPASRPSKGRPAA